MFPETEHSKEPGGSLENEELRVTGVGISGALTPGVPERKLGSGSMTPLI